MSFSIATLVRLEDGNFRSSTTIGAGNTVSSELFSALEGALDLDAAKSGKPFKIGESAINKGGFIETLKQASEEELDAYLNALRGAPSSSSSGRASPAPALVWGTDALKQREDGKIDPDVLEQIRSFVPTESDMKFTFVDFEPTQSAVLGHRQRAMALINRGYTIAQIKLMVENKKTKFVADKSVAKIVLGIPQKRLALCLCDTVLLGVETSYTKLVRGLYDQHCSVNDGMMALVPEYIGAGGKTEKTAPTAEESARRKRAFMNATANYLRPLFNNQDFRTMIDAASKRKEGGQG